MLAERRFDMALDAAPASGFNTAMEFKAANQSRPPVIAAKSQNNNDFSNLLLAVAQNKDKEAFAELFDYFAPRIKSFLMKGGAAPDAADELAQETMLAVWQKADRFDPKKAAASTWIFTIARNKRIDSIRSAPRAEFDPADPMMVPDEDLPEAGENLDRQTETETMAAAIESLPKDQADLLYKSFFEEKTHADIAKETGVPLGTVKSRIRLALEKLRGEQKVKALWS